MYFMFPEMIFFPLRFTTFLFAWGELFAKIISKYTKREFYLMRKSAL